MLKVTQTVRDCEIENHTNIQEDLLEEKFYYSKKKGEPRSKRNSTNRNATANSMETTDKVRHIFAGIIFCQEINHADMIPKNE